MGELTLPAGFDLPGHEIPTHDVEGCRPSVDPQPITLAERFEPIVVADRMTVVLLLVADEVDPKAGPIKAREATIVVDGQVAHGTDGQLDIGWWRVAVWQAASTAEGGVCSRGRCAAAEAGEEKRLGRSSHDHSMPWDARPHHHLFGVADRDRSHGSVRRVNRGRG